jgi:hypothetical protein
MKFANIWGDGRVVSWCKRRLLALTGWLMHLLNSQGVNDGGGVLEVLIRYGGL